ncbi:unnamed protein product, partial [Mesorhabditis spiculigera]
MTAKLRELLPGATILTPHHRGLAQTTQQMHTLIVRIENKEPAVKSKLGKYTDGNVVQVMTSYDELAVGVDGRLCIPCNVDVSALLEFLQQSAGDGKLLQKRMQEARQELEKEAALVAGELGLPILDWESNLPLDAVLKSVRRLPTMDPQAKDLIKGLHVRLSTNTTVAIQAVIISIYDETMQAGDCETVTENFGDYLTSVGA